MQRKEQKSLEPLTPVEANESEQKQSEPPDSGAKGKDSGLG